MTPLDLALKLQQLLTPQKRPGRMHEARQTIAELIRALKEEDRRNEGWSRFVRTQGERHDERE